MPAEADDNDVARELIAGLRNSTAYAHATGAAVEVKETHISFVFMAGEFAYKVKKAIVTDFLDYGTLARRQSCCEEEVRLGRRYASDLYLGVVPICRANGELRVDGEGEPVEYAVKMRRFPAGALLSEQIDAGKLAGREVHQLATTVAEFHRLAAVCDRAFALGSPRYIFDNAQSMLRDLLHSVDAETAAIVDNLREWSEAYFSEYRDVFMRRIDDQFIRECHGDLHLQNVVRLGDRLIPFDGIEFNERLRWIDVMSDAAFLAMDLAAHGHLELSHSFISSYLEHTGDHKSMGLLRWFLMNRAIVRAMVASMRACSANIAKDRATAMTECRDHIGLAMRYTLRKRPVLWITHGVSGSGKTTRSEMVVQRGGAIRLRSDIERKRLFGLDPLERPSPDMKAKLYSESSNKATYARLEELAEGILAAGYSAIVDATFMRRRDRDVFHALADRQSASFAILQCDADEDLLRRRVAGRVSQDTDASDADATVLERQLVLDEPLSHAERELAVDDFERAATGKFRLRL